MLMRLACVLVVLLANNTYAAQEDPAPAEPPDAATPAAAAPEAAAENRRPLLTWSADFTFAAVLDESLSGALGRERQIKPVAAIVAMNARLSKNVSLHLQTNPVRDDRTPRPYVPHESDRRTFFFPNQPDAVGSRGVSSDPEGLYKVDAYKHTGLDPLIQVYMMRAGYADVHTASGAAGLRVGRFQVRQGLQLEELTWFTAKDLTTVQLINAHSDNGLSFYWKRPRFEVTTQVVTGNGNPYQDYAYYDFTDATEDKNSAVGVIADARVHLGRGRVMVGGSLRRNYINSRIEDSVTLQLSKRSDDARMVYARMTLPGVQVYGEWAHYTVGLAPSSAELLPGPAVQSPVGRGGFYVGARASAPTVLRTKLQAVIESETTSRNDSLVAWAAANQMFGARLGANIKATNAKLVATWGDHYAAFAFMRFMKNPFPQLSAITPISGPNSERASQHAKVGVGVRVRF